MKKICLFIALSCAGFPALHGQNLNPTVEVTRTYEGKLIEAHKPQIGMTVPDSLMKFDLNFDYSVFDNPYKGSYEFNPYRLAMAPVHSSQKPGRFHLKAGAGYELHPLLDLVWAPVQRERFRMNIYATHRSFVGGYRKFKPSLTLSGLEAVQSDGLPQNVSFERIGGRVKGYDILSDAGLDMRYDWNRGRFDFGASYFGIAQKDWIRKRGYDALNVNIGVSSKSDRDEYFLYDLRAAYRFAEDKTDYTGKEWLSEHIFEFDAVLGQVFGAGGSLLFDFGVDMAVYGGIVNTNSGNFHIVPHYTISRGRWIFDLGVRVSALIPGSDDFGHHKKGQYVYPDVTISVNPIKDAMKIYFHAGGGEKINTLASVLDYDSHYDYTSGRLMDNIVERFSFVLGIEGRIATRFGYHLKAGYINYANAFLDGISAVPSMEDDSFYFIPLAKYGQYNKWFIGLDWDWKAESIDFKGHLLYNGLTRLDSMQEGFAPARFYGDASFTYNWKKRIFIGADCRWAIGRSGNIAYMFSGKNHIASMSLPGYADLGVNFEYAFNRKLSLWARGGNLLNKPILRSPLYAEGGISFTAGICLNF